MKVNIRHLAGTPLDAAVALALGGTNLLHDTVCTWWVTLDGKDRALSSSWAQAFCPSSNFAHGGPIMEHERMSVVPFDDRWEARCAVAVQRTPARFVERRGPTMLIAAMRCLVAAKFGEEVELPDDLAAAV